MAAKNKKRKAFWSNIKFKYKLTIINENTLEETFGLRVSKLNGLSVLLSALTVLFLCSVAIITFTPLKNYLPGYMNSNIRSQVVANALLADSLQEVVQRQNLYILSIQDIFSGKVSTDSVQSIDSITTIREDSLIERSQRETDFIKSYEESEKYNLSSIAVKSNLSGLIFYRPARGVIERHFDIETEENGIMLAVNLNEGILSVLDGTVIQSTYTADGGYVMLVQHSQDFISVYKHCGSLMKEVGDCVCAGDVIALAGRLDEDDLSGFWFELWHKGVAVNPEKYIAF